MSNRGFSMLRIETGTEGSQTILRLIGRIRDDDLEQLRELIRSQAYKPILDLEEVNLVDRASVQFLRDCQDRKVELRHCAPYIREWIERERAEVPLPRHNRRKPSNR
jgi:hypothetical protein